jgi:DNA-binding transcriptional regulator YiaG
MTPSEIKALKDKSRLSWRGFANEIGVSERTVRYWCDPDNPKRPGWLALQSLALFAERMK